MFRFTVLIFRKKQLKLDSSYMRISSYTLRNYRIGDTVISPQSSNFVMLSGYLEMSLPVLPEWGSIARSFWAYRNSVRLGENLVEIIPKTKRNSKKTDELKATRRRTPLSGHGNTALETPREICQSSTKNVLVEEDYRPFDIFRKLCAALGYSSAIFKYAHLRIYVET